jgi:hypothetical protein
MPPSPLFKPFRALGYITDSVPFAVQRRCKETFVTVSVGRTWQVNMGISSPRAYSFTYDPSGGIFLYFNHGFVDILQVYNCGKLTLVLVGPQVRIKLTRHSRQPYLCQATVIHKTSSPKFSLVSLMWNKDGSLPSLWS